METAPQKQPNPRKWLILAAAFLLLFIAQRLGCGPVKTEEKVEWIDR
jgi:hypothetical protein